MKVLLGLSEPFSLVGYVRKKGDKLGNLST